MTGQALALNAGWTSSEPTLTNAALQNASATQSGSANYGVTNTNATVTWPYPGYGWHYHDYWYPYYVPITVKETEPARPIKLTMTEVERLRVAAKRDKELRLTLEKFTPLIEVQVDFDK